MITIRKGDAPRDFIRAGEEHARELCAAYDADPQIFGTGRQNIRERIYQSVRPVLDACHHGKCCYCEAPLDANSEVEHWRPSSRYYWLAYSWDNLLLCCGFCNKKKLNQFPIEDEGKRALNHTMRLDDETPALLKPDSDVDLRIHIKFEGERPEGLTDPGRKTIIVLGLDCWKHSGRKRHLDEIKQKHAAYVLNFNSAEPEKRLLAEVARRLIEEAVLPDKPFSAMAAAYLNANPLP